MKKSIVMFIVCFVLSGTLVAESELAVGLIEMVLVEAGSFDMGSNDGDEEEKPVHRVTLTKNYYMGSYEVTQVQWYGVMATNPSYHTPSSGWENLPVEQVSWYDAIEFCNALSEMEGLEPYYSINKTKTDANNSNDFDKKKWTVTPSNASGAEKGYRLPTEAEWEYAARGGKDGDHSLEYSGSNSVGSVAWYYENSDYKTHEVGTKQANALGLSDMSGNPWEWCWDWYGAYSSSSTSDPTGASEGSNRVIRGGAFYNPAHTVRVAFRNDGPPSGSGDNVGFRVARFP